MTLNPRKNRRRSLSTNQPITQKIWKAFNLSTNGKNLYLGSLTPWRNENALQAVHEAYMEALGRANRAAGLPTNGRPSKEILSYNDYLHAISNADRDIKSLSRGDYMHRDTPALRAFLSSFSPRTYTANASGYAQYIANIVPGLWGMLKDDVPANLPSETRQRHTYIVASTGSGKSELIKAMIAEHARIQDCAILLLDPHSDLANDTALLPVISRSKRLIYASVDVQKGKTFTINPLQVADGMTLEDKEKIAFNLSSSINSLTGNSSTDRMVRFLRMVIMVLLERPGSTLVDLYDMTQNQPPADIVKLGSNHPNAMVRDFFKNVIQTTDMQKAKEGVRARLSSMLDATTFQQVTCGPSTINLEEAINQKKIIIFDLGSMGKSIGCNVGLLIMAMVSAIGERRQTNKKLPRSPVHVFVDECQTMVSSFTLTILEEMRKFGVYLTLAQQRAGQSMTREMREGVISNPYVKLLGQTDMPGDMPKAMNVSDDITQQLVTDKQQQLFQFACRWGRGSKPFILNVRTDLAGQRVSKGEWGKVMQSQIKAYYRPLIPKKPQKSLSNEYKRPSRKFL